MLLSVFYRRENYVLALNKLYFAALKMIDQELKPRLSDLRLI